MIIEWQTAVIAGDSFFKYESDIIIKKQVAWILFSHTPKPTIFLPKYHQYYPEKGSAH